MSNYIGQPYTRLAPTPTRRIVDAAPMREHVLHLIELGMTSLMIARAAGTSESPLTRTLRGQSRVYADVAEAVLAVTPRPDKQQPIVLAYSAKRRLEALSVMGWSAAAIAREMGVQPNVVWRARSQERITWDTYQRVCETYDRLAHRDGGSRRAKSDAKERGYVHPLDWDDIDEYEATPLPRMTLDEYRATEVAFFESLGYSEAEVAAALGIKLDTLQVWKRRTQAVAA